MNTPITAHSKALADEGRCAAEELVKAKHQIVAELARVTAENTRLRADKVKLGKIIARWIDVCKAVRAELAEAKATIAHREA